MHTPLRINTNCTSFLVTSHRSVPIAVLRTCPPVRIVLLRQFAYADYEKIPPPSSSSNFAAHQQPTHRCWPRQHHTVRYRTSALHPTLGGKFFLESNRLRRRVSCCSCTHVPPGSWHFCERASITSKILLRQNCSKGIAGTHTPSRIRMTRSAPSSRSCHECDEGAERATVMAASPSSCGRHGLAGIVRTMSEKACVGNFHYEKVGFTVSHGPGRFLCYHFRIAVSVDAGGHLFHLLL